LATREHVSFTPFCVFIAVFWLKARFHTLQNDMDLAIFYFDKVGHLLYPAMDALIFVCTSHVDLYVHQSVINSECTILTKLISKRWMWWDDDEMPEKPRQRIIWN